MAWQYEIINHGYCLNYGKRVAPLTIGVVIPCYKVRQYIIQVIQSIGNDITHILCVDDFCPEKSGQYILEQCHDSRVEVIFHERNQGVGGATMTGMRAALTRNCQIIVKLDGDGQMNPKDIPKLIAPLLARRADYAKGNRFFDIQHLSAMPKVRLVGNACLSFMAKFSTGYWHLFDPTNGFTAIHATVARQLPYEQISQNYFFESDLLFRLNILGAVVEDVPLAARYGHEVSNMNVWSEILPFAINHTKNFFKRIFYNYFLRSFSIVSIELIVGLILLIWGISWGGIEWIHSLTSGVTRTAGTVILAALPILLGVQFILAFLSYDMSTIPRIPLQLRLWESEPSENDNS